MTRQLKRGGPVAAGIVAVFLPLGAYALTLNAVVGASALLVVGALAALVREARRRRDCEAELARTDAYLHGIIEAMTDVVFVKDTAGRYVLINSAGAAFVGKPVEAILGSTDRTLFSGDAASKIMEHDARIMRDGARRAVEEIRTTNGVTRSFASTKVPVRDRSGALLGLVGVSRDVTDRKNEDEARVREVLLLLELNEMLQACRGLEEAYDVLAKIVPPFFPDVSGSVALFHASRTSLEVRASWHVEGESHGPAMFEPDDCWALRRGQPYVVESSNAVKCRHVERSAASNTLCLPLLAQGQVLGVLHVGSKASIEEDTHHRALLVGEQLSMSLANLELREVLRHQSIRDPLTGLFNRRYVEGALDQEVKRATREASVFSLLMMDVDHFKRFNDTYGHAAGDEVLRSIAKLLGQQIRGSDVASRVGGEELLVILPGAPSDAARAKAEELCRAIMQLEVKHLGANVGPVTVSIGVATFPMHGERPDVLMRAADDALYRAKRAGRNRVVLGGERQTQRGFRVTRTT